MVLEAVGGRTRRISASSLIDIVSRIASASMHLLLAGKQAEPVEQAGRAGAMEARDMHQLVADGLGGGMLHPRHSAG